MYHWFRAAGLAAMLALAGTPLFAQQGEQADLDALADELVRLRGEVESLSERLAEKRARHRTGMQSLSAQRGELEATLRQEELRIRQLEQDLADNRERGREAGIAGEELAPVAAAAIDDLERHVRDGIPFKTGDRINALEGIRSSLESGAQPASRVINRVWSFYQDELRLTSENGLYSQTIPLGGDEVLADTAKIGTVALYFTTREGAVGHAVERGGDWSFVELEGGADISRVRDLFDSLRKQIRTGFFTLPNGSIELESGR
ncbi:MAG: DUF3450 family protein [Candidatus Wenzhouxiangella sp. M2_3B_020]